MFLPVKPVYAVAVILAMCLAFTSVANAPLSIKSYPVYEKGLMVHGNTGPPTEKWGFVSAVLMFDKYLPKFSNPSEKLSL